MIDLNAETAVTLAPHLKTAQLKAMMNGDDFIPILPHFEIYKIHISHSRAPSQVTTDVLGVKGLPKDAKLLGKFFARMLWKQAPTSEMVFSYQSPVPINIQTGFEGKQLFPKQRGNNPHEHGV